MLERSALSIAKRMGIALQLEHALSCVTKAYERYLMNVARLVGYGGQKCQAGIDTVTLTTTGDTSSCSSTVIAPDICAGHRRRFAANSFAGLRALLIALPFCKPGCHADLVTT